MVMVGQVLQAELCQAELLHLHSVARQSRELSLGKYNEAGFTSNL
jgi:hypothetical protein